MSTWMWENCCCSTGIGCMVAAGWLVTLALEQAWQSFTHSVMSSEIDFHHVIGYRYT